LALYHIYVRRCVALLAAIVVVSAFLYGFFLLEAVSHAASQAKVRRDIAGLSSKVAMLQAQYLSATKAITPERARVLGFVAPTAVATVYTGESGLSLSANQ
jgi:hypothetical protein